MMPRKTSVLLTLSLLTSFGLMTLLSGCGGEGGGEVKPSPEAKKADQDLQKNMQEFMQGKGQAKKK